MDYYSAICKNMHETGGHYIEWNKPDRKGKYCIVLLMCGI